jgi:acetyl-CoA acyltransferase
VAKRNGMFRNVRPDDMLAHAIRAVVAQAPGIDPARIGDVIVGCAMPEAEQGMNVARIGALLAGLPNTVPGITINRFCSSGLQAVADAANQIRLGLADVMIAAGTESMTVMPTSWATRWRSTRPVLRRKHRHRLRHGPDRREGGAAVGISREAQDAFAGRPTARPAPRSPPAISRPRSRPSPCATTSPIWPPARSASATARRPTTKARARTSPSRSWPSCARSSTPGLGHRRQRLADVRWRRRRDAGLGEGPEGTQPDAARPLCRLCRGGRGAGDHGHRPDRRDPQGAAAGRHPQGRPGLDRAQRSLRRPGAGRVKELDLDPSKINPLGGAIALGHPLGATGAIRTATLLHGMRRTGGKYGMVSMCIGTGMGAAGIFESI